MTSEFGTIFSILYVAHHIGDFWLQTDWQATTKGLPGAAGRRACALHVAVYTAAFVGVLTIITDIIDVDLSFGRVVLAAVITATTHYIADRRKPLHRLALLFRHGGAWLDNGGLAQLDQAWHVGWLVVAALILV